MAIRQGGGPLRYDDQYFVASAKSDVDRLTAAGLRTGESLIDFGCGPGRIAIGLIASSW